MKLHKTWIALGLAAALGITATTALAADGATKTDLPYEKRPAITDEQKAKMEADRAAIKEKQDAVKAKWAAMTQAQKDAIYNLLDQQVTVENQLIDQYAANGLLDADTAKTMKDRNTQQAASLRSSGGMPGGMGIGGGVPGMELGGHGQDGRRPSKATPSTLPAN